MIDCKPTTYHQQILSKTPREVTGCPPFSEMLRSPPTTTTPVVLLCVIDVMQLSTIGRSLYGENLFSWHEHEEYYIQVVYYIRSIIASFHELFICTWKYLNNNSSYVSKACAFIYVTFSFLILLFKRTKFVLQIYPLTYLH